jgi:hypothetical protein
MPLPPSSEDMSQPHADTKAASTPQVSLRRSLRISPVGWLPPSDPMEHPEWVAAGRRLGGISRCNQWWLGDWVRYGTAKWGEKYVEAARITGYDPRSLANMASIATSFELSRRRDMLTWSHHAVVAALEPEEQDRWLDVAVAKRFSVADLRIELRSVKRIRDRPNQRAAVPPSQTVAAVTCPQCGYQIAQNALAGVANAG